MWPASRCGWERAAFDSVSRGGKWVRFGTPESALLPLEPRLEQPRRAGAPVALPVR
jgi:hypothetical protein